MYGNGPVEKLIGFWDLRNVLRRIDVSRNNIKPS